MSVDNAGVSMPSDYVEAIDEHHIRLGYFYRSEFVRAAVKEKFEREDIEVDLPEP